MSLLTLLQGGLPCNARRHACSAYIKLIWQGPPWACQKGPNQPEVGGDGANPLHCPVRWDDRQHEPPALCWSIWGEGVLLAAQRRYTTRSGHSQLHASVVLVVCHTPQTCLAPITAAVLLKAGANAWDIHEDCLVVRLAAQVMEQKRLLQLMNQRSVVV